MATITKNSKTLIQHDTRIIIKLDDYDDDEQMKVKESTIEDVFCENVMYSILLLLFLLILYYN